MPGSNEKAGVVPPEAEREAHSHLGPRHLKTPEVRVGGPAFAFELPRVDVDRRAPAEVVRLADYRGRRPVLLAFGSNTCAKFRAGYEHIEALASVYGDRVAFLVVYIREAHPLGGWELAENQEAGIAIEDPVDSTARLEAACDLATSLPIRLPLLVDGADDRVASAFGGWPAQVCLVGRKGVVRHSCKISRLDELERAIRRELRWRPWT